MADAALWREGVPMRGCVVTALAVLTISSAALADDLPANSPGSAPTAPAAPNWTGFYIGGNIDYATDNKFGGSATGSSQQPNGGFVGGHAGYNQQTGPFVLGIEGNIDTPVSRFGR